MGIVSKVPGGWWTLGIIGFFGVAALATPRLLPMLPGNWYVVEGTTPKGGVPGNVRALLIATTNFSDIQHLSIGDGRITFVGRWGGPGNSVSPLLPSLTSITSIRAASLTEIPPQQVISSNLLDPGIPTADAKALAFAVMSETNPTNLRVFGSTFLPDFPRASSYLLLMAGAREHALQYGNPNAKTSAFAVLTAREKEKGGVSQFLNGPTTRISGASVGAFEFAANALGDFVSATGDVVETVGNGISDGVTWAYDNLGQFGILIPVVWEGVSSYRVLNDLAAGKSLSDVWDSDLAQQVKNLGHGMRLAAGVVSFFPGFGTVAGVILNVGAGIALGENVSDLAIDAAAGAIPGGGIAQEIFRFCAHTAVGVINGETIGVALQASLRQEVVMYVGPAGGVAYDAAFDLASGHNVSTAALDAGRELVRNYAGDDAARAYDISRSSVQGDDRAAIQAARDLVKRYGGEDAAKVFDVAVDAAKGKTLEDISIDAARNLIGTIAGEDARHAFDLGMAVGTAKGLQQAGFREGYSLLQGNDVPSRAKDFVAMYRTATEAARGFPGSLNILAPDQVSTVSFPVQSKNVGDLLLERIADTRIAYEQAAEEEILNKYIKPAIQFILTDPETDPTKMLSNLEIPDLSKALWDKLGFYISDVRTQLARSCVSQIVVVPRDSPSFESIGVSMDFGDAGGPVEGSSALKKKSRTIPIANQAVIRELFLKDVESIPASAIQGASEIAGSSTSMGAFFFGKDAAFNVIATKGAAQRNPSLVADVVNADRAKSFVNRGTWVRYYQIVETRVTRNIQTGAANPFAVQPIAHAVNPVGATRQIEILRGDAPRNADEEAWYEQTFFGPYGDPRAAQNVIDMKNQLGL